MQMPIGIIADKLNRNYLFAVIGCVLVGAAYGIPLPVAAVAVIGIGNAMFHIGGGIDVLNISEKKLWALGLFVSPGAFGVYYGTIFGRGSGFSQWYIIAAVFTAALLIFALYRAQRGAYPKNAVFSLDGVNSRGIIAAIICLFFVVCLRSFVGLTVNFSWKTAGWGTVLICAVVIGKIMGGIAADRFGLLRTSVISLIIAAILFMLPAVPAAGVAAVLLFNMTMPVTLWVMAKIFPGAKGFSFGLLTFALFLGFLPVYLGVQVPLNLYWFFAVFTAVSLALLLIGLRKAKSRL